ncbi:RHS repeat-associated core domain-containing protein [Niveispirillum sp. SYP-B3756]|uniref:RHS repeat-associated core domain-containing protein n=1 Tax=Niveispirillum sp. SYP-B3756 TaxID=2662178 RepID=UPI0032B4CC90
MAVERQDRRGRTLARYGYDAFGRRLWKQTTHLPPASANDDAPSPAPAGDAPGLIWQRTDFLWDGDVLLGESATYAPDALSPDPLAQLRRSAGADQRPQVYHYHLDHLGTPQELTNDNGELVWQAEYRAWGALAKLHVADVENPLRFQGQYHDAETGLHYNRHRYYAPNEGCFTSQDPIRLAGGSNLAAYAPNPVEWVDPLGLSNYPGVDFKGSPDLFPTTGDQRNIVQINMQGARGRDFTQAFTESNIPRADASDYTWHHLDDFDPVTGKTTMQLVKTSAHEATFTHSGSVSQFEKHFGVEYDTRDAVNIADENGWLKGRPPR